MGLGQIPFYISLAAQYSTPRTFEKSRKVRNTASEQVWFAATFVSSRRANSFEAAS